MIEIYTGQHATAAPASETGRWPRWWPFAAIATVAALMFVLRLSAPPDLMDQDQERPAAYVLDVIKNGNWLCQRDVSGDIMSKPPFYTWLCAVVAQGFGRINLFALYLPGALAGLAIAWLIFGFGRAHFGVRAGMFGALASMLTSAGFKEFGLARTDGVFALTVTAAALLAFRAWSGQRGWTWFWLAAAAATLTKGPLGVVLAGSGLLAMWWESKSGEPWPMRGQHWIGVGLFILLTAGWFFLAYWNYGPPLVAKLIGKELVGHAMSSTGKRHLPGTLIYQQPLYYLGRAAPWSVLAYYGFWRIWKHPAVGPEERRFERFLFCWFLPGLLLFSLAPHQRGDLLWPLMPAGALVAGRELARLTHNIRTKVLLRWSVVVVVAIIGGFGFYYFDARPGNAVVRQTVAVRKLAVQTEQLAGREFPLTHLDDPMAMQIYLNTLRPRVSAERAAELLRGPAAAFVAVNNIRKLESARRASDPPMYSVLPRAEALERSAARIVGNRPELKATEAYAFCFGTVFVEVHGAELLKASEKGFWFRVSEKSADVMVTNETGETRSIRICSEYRGKQEIQERALGPNEVWKTTFFGR